VAMGSVLKGCFAPVSAEVADSANARRKQSVRPVGSTHWHIVLSSKRPFVRGWCACTGLAPA
jgi:hypothetical protein